MKKKGIWLTLVVLVILVIGATMTPKKTKKEVSEPVFWVLSDTHLITTDLYESGEEFERIKLTSAGKELEYQEDSLRALVDLALEEKPTGIIITGDLTLNGERKSAEKLAEILSPLKKAEINYYVIPGNHDIHDGWAREFKKDSAVKTTQISPKNFEDIFSWSYENSSQKDEHSLSYSVAVNDQLQFLMLDTNIYGKQPGTTVPQTKGELKKETFSWVEEQLLTGKEKGVETIVFMHHNLLQHNDLISTGFVIKENETLKMLLSKYKVPLVFSGHTHAQSIKTDKKDNITEIVTASYSISEQIYGEVKFNQDTIFYEKKRVDVDKWAKETGETDENLLNYQQFTKDLFIEDGKRMAYVQLIESGFYDEKKLDAMADFVGEANWRYFTGNQLQNKDDIEALKNSNSYQLIKKESPFLLEYMDSIVEIDNHDNNQIELTCIK